MKTNDPRLALTIPQENIEMEAWKQIEDILTLDCLKRLAIMPDVHAGYDMPIGGVALLEGFISPSFVGYDIGVIIFKKKPVSKYRSSKNPRCNKTNCVLSHISHLPFDFIFSAHNITSFISRMLISWDCQLSL